MTTDAPPAKEPTPRSSESGTPDAGGIALAALGFVAFAVAFAYVRAFTADDAYITFRHARNLVDGFGASYARSGPPVEGTTSLGFVAICAIAEALSLPVAWAAKAVSIGAALATGASAAALARLLSDIGPERGRLAPSFAFAAAVGFHATAVHAASGMETLVAAALFTEATRRTCDPLRARRPVTLALFVAAGLTRPELHALAIVVLMQEAWVSDPTTRRARLARVALGYVFPAAVSFAARAAYYGHLMPLPFTVKVAGGAFFPGSSTAVAFTTLAIACLGVPLACALLRGDVRRMLLPVPLLVVIGATPDPVMNFDHRYFMPIWPLLAAAAGVGVEDLSVRIAKTTSARRALALTCALTFAAASADQAYASLLDRAAYGAALERSLATLGRNLARYRRESGHTPTIALGDIGAVGYFSGWNVIDTHGLADPEVAHAEAFDAAAVLARNPDLVGVVSTNARTFSAHWASPHDRELFDACRQRGLAPAVIVPFSAASFTFVMARPGSDVARFLQHVYLGRPR